MRLLRERLRYRITLVRIGTAIKCRVRALLGKLGIEPPHFSDLFGKAGREWLAQVVMPEEYRQNLDGYLRTLDHLTTEMETDKPCQHFAEHKKKYPPGQAKKNRKQKKS